MEIVRRCRGQDWSAEVFSQVDTHSSLLRPWARIQPASSVARLSCLGPVASIVKLSVGSFSICWISRKIGTGPAFHRKLNSAAAVT